MFRSLMQLSRNSFDIKMKLKLLISNTYMMTNTDRLKVLVELKIGKSKLTPNDNKTDAIPLPQMSL